ERESRGGPSALEPGVGTAAGRVPQAQDAVVQRIRGSGGSVIYGHGLKEKLLAMQLRRILSNRWMKVPVFALCLSPGLRLIWKGFNGLGANRIEFITHSTGDWTLRFLAITLAVTTLRKRLRLPALVRLCRM